MPTPALAPLDPDAQHTVPLGDASVLLTRGEYTVQANRKVLAENHGECYHCGLSHPELVRITRPAAATDTRATAATTGSWVG